MNESVFAEGIRVFNPRETAPDFVIGSLVITPNDLITWLKANQSLMTEYQGKKQLRLDIKRSQDGRLYAQVDTWKPTVKPETAPTAPSNAQPAGDDLPF